VVEIVGEQSIDLLIDVHRRALTDPRYVQGMPRLFDDRKVTSYVGPLDQIEVLKALAPYIPPASVKRKVAAVSADPMAPALAKIFNSARDAKQGPDLGALEYRHFATMEEAEAWLREAKGG